MRHDGAGLIAPETQTPIRPLLTSSPIMCFVGAPIADDVGNTVWRVTSAAR
jgi:hypothetical protein